MPEPLAPQELTFVLRLGSGGWRACRLRPARSCHGRRRTPGKAGHTAVRQCRSWVDEKSTHCQPVQARLSTSSDEAIRQRSDHVVVPVLVGLLRGAVPGGGLTHEIFDRSVQSRACRLSLRDGVCCHRATGRVPIGALPKFRRHHGSDRPSSLVPATQYVTTREANQS